MAPIACPTLARIGREQERVHAAHQEGPQHSTPPIAGGRTATGGCVSCLPSLRFLSHPPPIRPHPTQASFPVSTARIALPGSIRSPLRSTTNSISHYHSFSYSTPRPLLTCAPILSRRILNAR